MPDHICDGEFAGPAACVCGHWERHVADRITDEVVDRAANTTYTLWERYRGDGEAGPSWTRLPAARRRVYRARAHAALLDAFWTPGATDGKRATS